MATISGESNWRLLIRREDASVTILRALTCDAQAILPATLFNLPVTQLGRHALSTMERDIKGESVLVTCGTPSIFADWDNRKLRELSLPPQLLSIGDYAFLNCRNLQCLRLSDHITRWGGNTLMNCDALHHIVLQRDGKQGTSLYTLVNELSQELVVTIEENRQITRLLFPEYKESDDEAFIAQAVQFQYHISGAGYQYHQCFVCKKLDLYMYDRVWTTFLQRNFEPMTAVQLAFMRLQYPTELSSHSKAAYLSYLSAHTGAAVRWLLERQDTRGLAFLLDQVELSADDLSAGCEQARRSGATEALGILLAERHRRAPIGAEKCFDL